MEMGGVPGVKHEKLVDELANDISDERLDEAAELGQDIVDDSDKYEQVAVESATGFPN